MNKIAKTKTSILICDKSMIVKEGLTVILEKYSNNNFLVDFFSEPYNVESLENELHTNTSDLVILPLDLFSNRNKEFQKLKRMFPSIHWGTIVYGFYSNEDISMYDFTIFMTDDAETIAQKIDHLVVDSGKSLSSENLTDREIEILKGLAVGKSNKQIADELKISIHTVISHRKNISEKTSIRTLQGLTVYAISKHLIDVNCI
ncbi:MAG: helix-turn-helix transcriptional regulator [Bacteroidales bacterium]|nr:helix-turn-helix transcriptional regulator [Bacteroidales bacterium]